MLNLFQQLFKVGRFTRFRFRYEFGMTPFLTYIGQPLFLYTPPPVMEYSPNTARITALFISIKIN
jgi:hypothetical protein